MAKILIIEDEDSIADVIRINLSLPGHDVYRASDGDFALELIEEETFDLALLDLMLGKTSGETVLTRLVEKEIPVIVLSAKSNITDQVRCLRMGADDYITKPFNSLDLVTRVDVVLRVHKKIRVPSGAMFYKDIMVDKCRHEVLLSGERVELTPKEYDLLVFFIENAGNVLPRTQIASTVWGYAFDRENRTIDIHVQRLRKKLGLTSALKTVSKVGYLLEGAS